MVSNASLDNVVSSWRRVVVCAEGVAVSSVGSAFDALSHLFHLLQRRVVQRPPSLLEYLFERAEALEDTKTRRPRTLRVASPLGADEEGVVTRVVDTGFAVHSILGPGFKERIYERAFCLELDVRGLRYECEKPVDVVYKAWRIPGQKIDLIVENLVLVELKCVPRLRPLHRKQFISYLKTTNLRVALLMNFNCELFKNGVKRVVL